METRREEPPKALESGATPKPKRFRIVKLEERIAPSKGGQGTHNGCTPTGTCSCYASCGSCATECCDVW
jgi:hypothetical protein